MKKSLKKRNSIRKNSKKKVSKKKSYKKVSKKKSMKKRKSIRRIKGRGPINFIDLLGDEDKGPTIKSFKTPKGKYNLAMVKSGVDLKKIKDADKREEYLKDLHKELKGYKQEQEEVDKEFLDAINNRKFDKFESLIQDGANVNIQDEKNWELEAPIAHGVETKYVLVWNENEIWINHPMIYNYFKRILNVIRMQWYVTENYIKLVINYLLEKHPEVIVSKEEIYNTYINNNGLILFQTPTKKWKVRLYTSKRVFELKITDFIPEKLDYKITKEENI